MTTKGIQPCSREFQFLIGLDSNDTVGLAYEITVVVCETKTDFLLLGCHIEQCHLKKVARFFKIFIRFRLECGIGLWNYSHNHLGKVHLLCIEVRFSSTKQCTSLAVLLVYSNRLE